MIKGIVPGLGGKKKKEPMAKATELKLDEPKKDGFEFNPTKWFKRGMSEEQRAESLKKLASQLDIDRLRAAFIKHAGPDELMDQSEFERFAKAEGIMHVAAQLWTAMDSDRSGSVDKDEFLEALAALSSARAFMRFCPTCMFENECEMCVKVKDCDDCTAQRYALNPGLST